MITDLNHYIIESWNHMNKIVRDIIIKECSIEEKNKALNSLEDDIKIAKGILSGEFKYCKDCDDYYLAKSYLEEVESTLGKICVYEDPINSGGNEYVDGIIDITYSICPKGHRHKIKTEERNSI